MEKITIVGLGLIGGSLGLALKKNRPEILVTGVDLSPATIEEAVRRKAIDRGTVEIGEGVSGADLVILAIPVHAMPAMAAKMLPYLKDGAIISDVGSTKEQIVGEMSELLPPSVTFLGGHPMAGSEKWGLAGASELLFENAAYVLTPLPGRTDPTAAAAVQDVLQSIGAKTILLSPAEHDRKVAAVSHLPHLIASALVNTVGELEDAEPGYFTLAAGGFRDTTRIAASQSALWSEILQQNSQALLPLLDTFLRAVQQFEKALQTKDAAGLTRLLNDARLWREKVPIGLKGILPRMYELQVYIPDRPGSIAGLTNLLAARQINIIDIEIQRAREEDEGTIRLGFGTESGRDQAKKALVENGYQLRDISV